MKERSCLAGALCTPKQPSHYQLLEGGRAPEALTKPITKLGENFFRV